jgi:hypothetical protein
MIEIYFLLIITLLILWISRENLYVICRHLLFICYELTRIYVVTVLLTTVLIICGVDDVDEIKYSASILFVLLLTKN